MITTVELLLDVYECALEGNEYFLPYSSHWTLKAEETKVLLEKGLIEEGDFPRQITQAREEKARELTDLIAE